MKNKYITTAINMNTNVDSLVDEAANFDSDSSKCIARGKCFDFSTNIDKEQDSSLNIDFAVDSDADAENTDVDIDKNSKMTGKIRGEGLDAVTDADQKQKIVKFLFSVITPFFNTEKYIDDYFSSLTKQSLNFRKYIEVICVNDGSTDNTERAILDWKKKYPNNIKYFSQPNSGPANARNVGLDNATGKWVTCIDSDDFVNKKYFSIVKTALDDKKNAFTRLFICKPVAFFEKTKKTNDYHPLNFRFNKGIPKRIKLTANTPFIHVVESSAFLNRRVIEVNNIRYKEDVKPNFEDGEFMLRYMQAIENFDVVLLQKARYFARKRELPNSLYTSALANIDHYTLQPRNGFLRPLVQISNSGAKIPAYIQHTIASSLRQYIKRILNYPEIFLTLNRKVKDEYYAIIRNILKYIDDDTILFSYNPKFDETFRFLFITILKNKILPIRTVSIEKVELDRKLIRLSYKSDGNFDLSVKVNGKDTAVDKKHILLFEYDGVKICQSTIWMHFTSLSDAMEIVCPEGQIPVIRGGKHSKLPGNIRIRDCLPPPKKEKKLSLYLRMVKFFTQSAYYKNKYKESWIFIDRPDRADDNAEHLYRYVMNNHPEVNCYFILNKTSPCWGRLKKEGFRLIPFRTLNHVYALVNCSMLISSQLGPNSNTFLKPWSARLANFKFIYLGHGIFKDDLSDLLNKFSIDCFTRSTHDEYTSIVSDYTPYKLTRMNVALTGLPRHDALLQRKGEPGSNSIFFMPTWRKNLSLFEAGKRQYNPKFEQSNYFTGLMNFLTSAHLHKLLSHACLEIVFIPHPNMEQYLDCFSQLENVRVSTASQEGGFQNIFAKCKALITDYSSIAYDIILLNKPVIYYQFDIKDFYINHTYKKGFFDYRANGFGPVTENSNTLINELASLISNNFEIDSKYKSRAEKTFAYMDTNNCSRAFEAISALNQTWKQESKVVPANEFVNMPN